MDSNSNLDSQFFLRFGTAILIPCGPFTFVDGPLYVIFDPPLTSRPSTFTSTLFSKNLLSQNSVKIDDGDKQRFDDDTNQKKMILVHEKVKARRPKDFPGMDFQEACLAKHRFVGKFTVLKLN